MVLDYCASRAGQHAASFLGDWKGALMIDDHSGYKALFADGITELGCCTALLAACIAFGKHHHGPYLSHGIRDVGRSGLFRLTVKRPKMSKLLRNFRL